MLVVVLLLLVILIPDETIFTTKSSGDVERNQHHAAAGPGVRAVDHLRHHDAAAGKRAGIETAKGRCPTRQADSQGRHPHGGDQSSRIVYFEPSTHVIGSD